MSAHATAIDSVMGNQPEILQAFAPLHDVIMRPGALDNRTKVLAYLSASYVNECSYCVNRYQTLAREAGVKEDLLRAVQTEQDHLFDPPERAAIQIARELTGTCAMDDVPESELDIFSPAEYAELIAVISLANFENRLNNALPEFGR